MSVQEEPKCHHPVLLYLDFVGSSSIIRVLVRLPVPSGSLRNMKCSFVSVVAIVIFGKGSLNRSQWDASQLTSDFETSKSVCRRL